MPHGFAEGRPVHYRPRNERPERLARRQAASGRLKTREWKTQESEKYGKGRFQKCVFDCID